LPRVVLIKTATTITAKREVKSNRLLGLLLANNSLVLIEKVINISDRTDSQNQAVRKTCGSIFNNKIKGKTSARSKMVLIIPK